MSTLSPQGEGRRLAVARVTLEALTPFIVGTGRGDDFRDSVCVSDANGLPTIPGSSIAGVLRHAVAAGEDPDTSEACRKLFGFQEANQGRASRLEMSWAQVHDEDDRPVPFRLSQAPRSEFLSFLTLGVTRDHVRLNARGAADDKGKFDETLVPAGARFTFETVLEDPEEGEMERLVALLASPDLRFGGRSRRGFGAFRLVRAACRTFDLANPEDWRAYSQLPRRLEHEAKMLFPMKVDPPQAARGRAFKLRLKPEDYFLVAGGVPLDEHARRRKGEKEMRPADIVPVTEQVIEWLADEEGRERGRIGRRRAVLPASSIKGALRHRTAFHLRRLAGQWAESTPQVAWEDSPPELVELLGDATEGGSTGRPGKVFLRDVYIDLGAVQQGFLDHVCIDRFTGGPMDGMLFSEAPLYGRKDLRLELEIRIQGEVSERAGRAFREALEDLCRGRLALGAGANRGHGYFAGELVEEGVAA